MHKQQIKLSRKSLIRSSKIKEQTTFYGFIQNKKICGFTITIPINNEEEISEIIKPFWYPIVNNNIFYENTVFFNAYIINITETHYILNNNIKIKKELINISKLKELKKSENISLNDFNNIINGEELKKNILYPFRFEDNLIQIYNLVDYLCLGSRIMGQVYNNYIKTLNGKFKCIFLRNHLNKTVIEVECYKIINEEMIFKEVFKPINEIKVTFKIEKKIKEGLFLCVSKKIKGILKGEKERKEGDIVKCIVNITERGIFLIESNEGNISMAINFNDVSIDSNNNNNKELTLIDSLIKEAEHLKLNERLIYLIELIESKELNDKNIIIISLFYIQNIKKIIKEETIKKSINKIINLLKKRDKPNLIKEFLKSIYKNELFEESLINIYLQFNIKKPIILFYLINKQKNNLIEILEKEPQLINYLYANNKIIEIRNIIEILINKLNKENNLLFILFKTYILSEIKLKNYLYANNLFERMFLIKFKKSNARDLCNLYLKFIDISNLNINETEAALKCEDYVKKYLIN